MTFAGAFIKVKGRGQFCAVDRAEMRLFDQRLHCMATVKIPREQFPRSILVTSS